MHSAKSGQVYRVQPLYAGILNKITYSLWWRDSRIQVPATRCRLVGIVNRTQWDLAENLVPQMCEFFLLNIEGGQ